MRKRIKQINGVKVIHRHSGSVLWTALFCLLTLVVPILFLFIPWCKVSTGVEGDAGIAVTLIDMFPALLFKGDKLYLYLMTNHPFISGDPIAHFIAQYGTSIIMILFAISVVILVVYLILALNLIIRGRLNNFKTPYTLSWFLLIINILIFVCMMAYWIYLPLVGQKVGAQFNFYINLVLVILLPAVSLFITIVTGIIYGACFRNRLFFHGVEDLSYVPQKTSLNGYTVNHGNEGDSNTKEEQVLPSSKPENVRVEEPVKTIAEPNSELPQDLDSIGGHAFSKNTQLVIANIPTNIQEIGPGAFANCPNLKVVSIPKSVKSIGYNAFFNCTSLRRINYQGSKVEWRNIVRGSNWLLKAGTTLVHCVDGSLIVNPLR